MGIYLRTVSWLRLVLLIAGVMLLGMFMLPYQAEANAGADGSGTGDDAGVPTSGGGLYTSSTTWEVATNTSWTVPAGVNRIKVKLWGAGGGGGRGGTTASGGYGGPGGYVEGEIMVTPGQTLDVVVGAGGTGGTAGVSAGGGGLTKVASGTTDWFIAGSGGGGGQTSVESSSSDQQGGSGGGLT